MSLPTCFVPIGLCLLASPSITGPDPKALADEYVNAVRDLNDEHARKPVARSETELAKKLPKKALDAFEALITLRAEGALEQLARCGEDALDLDRVADFERARAAIGDAEARKLGRVISRPRFLMRGLDGVEPEGLEVVADTLDEVLAAYDGTFGFAEWSKVPGKKLRIRVHLVPKIERPPHFAPQYPWHSEIDFPVVDPRAFKSPTPDGKFLLYGLCHELGHVIAMWGDAREEEDHHAWAHYTGCVVVEHLARMKDGPEFLRDLRDVKWRSLAIERAQIAEKGWKAGRADRESVLTLFVAAHDLVGPGAIGDAIDALDLEDKRSRINRVRYYRLDAFGKALLATQEGRKKERELKKLLE